MLERSETESGRNIVLEELTPADIEKYVALERMMGSRLYIPWTTKKDILELLNSGKAYCVKVGEEIVGHVSYRIMGDGSVFIEGLAIDPRFRGRGYGRNAMEQLLVEIKDAKKIELVTHPENSAAVNLYQSFQFEIIERKENYFGNGEPRILMRKTNVK